MKIEPPVHTKDEIEEMLSRQDRIREARREFMAVDPPFSYEPYRQAWHDFLVKKGLSK